MRGSRSPRDFQWRWSKVPVPEPLLAAVAAAVALHVVVPMRLPIARASRAVGGVPLVAVGAALAGWAVASAGNVEVDQPERLVTGGAYGVTRNPMYLGWVAGLLGLAAFTRSAWLLLALAVAGRVLGDQVRAEERVLSGRFGAAFDEYVATTPRYLPSLARPR